MGSSYLLFGDMGITRGIPTTFLTQMQKQSCFKVWRQCMSDSIAGLKRIDKFWCNFYYSIANFLDVVLSYTYIPTVMPFSYRSRQKLLYSPGYDPEISLTRHPHPSVSSYMLICFVYPSTDLFPKHFQILASFYSNWYNCY